MNRVPEIDKILICFNKETKLHSPIRILLLPDCLENAHKCSAFRLNADNNILLYIRNVRTLGFFTIVQVFRKFKLN